MPRQQIQPRCPAPHLEVAVPIAKVLAYSRNSACNEFMRSPSAKGVPASRSRSGSRVSGDRSFSQHSTADDAIPYLLRQVAERLGRSLAEALKPFEQTPSVYRVLIALTRCSPARITEIAELTLIEPSTLSRTVDRMESDGLITRASGSDDGRTV